MLYDGSPLRDPAYLWKLVDELGITIFGTSAKYIDQLSVSVCVRAASTFFFRFAWSTSTSTCLDSVVLLSGRPHAVPRSRFLLKRSAFILPASLYLRLAGLTDILSLSGSV